MVLEIAAVPITNGEPDCGDAYCTLVNPGRTIPNRPWTSPGLTNQALRNAPTLAVVEPVLAARLNGRYLVGHNVGVDWRLLHRRCATIQPAGLIDTLRLARHVGIATGLGLAQLTTAHHLTSQVDALARGSRPHRALWDATAAAFLLMTLIEQRRWPTRPSLDDLTNIAGIPLEHPPPAPTPNGQPSLFDTDGPFLAEPKGRSHSDKR